MVTKLSDYVMDFIAAQGVRHVFTLVGGGSMHLDDSLGRCTKLEYICNLHEQASAIAAEAYARVTDNLGVALVTSGPGGTNTITGVAGAWIESTPCLFISGQAKRSDLMGDSGVRQMGAQEVDIVSMVRPITKYAVTVMDPAAIRYHLEKAVHLARSGRPGPVWLDIPLDVQATPIDPSTLAGFLPEEAEAPCDAGKLPSLVAQTIAMLNAAERPVILAGNGVRLAGARSLFLQIAEQLAIPVLTTRTNGVDLVPYAHALFMGRPGAMAARGANFTLQNADFLLVIGARMDAVQIGYSQRNLARGARKVMVDIDPAEIRKLEAIIDLPICADAGAFLEECARQSGSVAAGDRAGWLTRCREWKEKYPIVLDQYRAQQDYVSTYVFSEAVSDLLTADDLVVPGSSGAGIEIFLLVFQAKAGQRVFVTGGLGAMGFGLPAAIGACLASGRKRTISVDGDGGFQLNIQELETAARLNLPIKFFVLNNNGYASIRAMQRNYFQGHYVGSDAGSHMTLPDIKKVGAAYGLKVACIAKPDDLKRQILDVLETPGPVVCEVLVPPQEVRAPCLSSVTRPDGSMVSRPLEDLWPFLDREEFLSNMLVPPLDESLS